MHLLQRDNCLLSALPEVASAARRLPFAALCMLSRAVQAAQAGDAAAARAGCQSLLASHPDQPDALQVLAALLAQDNAWREALPLLVRAVEADPDNPALQRHLGCCLRRLGLAEHALSCFDRAVQLAPGDPAGHAARGTLLETLGRLDESMDSLQCALALAPGRQGSLLSLSALLHHMGRHAQALAVCEDLLGMAPESPEAWINRACCQRALGLHPQALASLARALLLKPDHAVAHFNMGYTLVEMGRWEEGWPMTEWRWRVPGAERSTRPRGRPQWNGWSRLDGRTVLLHNDQGLGDAIMLMRLASQLGQRGARVLLEVPAALLSLATQLPGIAQVVPELSESPPHDLHCPLFSLPAALGLRPDNVPSAGGYLRAEADFRAAWRRRLGPRRRPRVGIAWSGNPEHFLDGARSIPLARFAQALPPAVEVVALQPGVRDSDAPALAERPWIRRFGEYQADFHDTAALCDAMDLVLTVDTSIAHLAGALGKPTWVLLQHPAEYRWMASGDHTPWYDSLTLWRQAPEAGWDPLLQSVRARLERWAAEQACGALAA